MLMFLSCEGLSWSVTTPCRFPLCFKKWSRGLCQFSMCACLCCFCVCVVPPALPYHSRPFHRVITWSSTTDSKVSTADSLNNTDPPSSPHHICSPLEDINRPRQPQTYLCLRHPIIISCLESRMSQRFPPAATTGEKLIKK